jgi:hypothetical protein
MRPWILVLVPSRDATYDSLCVVPSLLLWRTDAGEQVTLSCSGSEYSFILEATLTYTRLATQHCWQSGPGSGVSITYVKDFELVVECDGQFGAFAAAFAMDRDDDGREDSTAAAARALAQLLRARLRRE